MAGRKSSHQIFILMRISSYRRGLTAAFLLPVLITSLSVSAQPTGFTEREVAFYNGEVKLSGTFMVPDQGIKVPAIVFLHGSGPHSREGFRSHAEEFAKLGIASLFFDKRGTGSSGGSWTTSSLRDLAEDGLAAVRWVKKQAEVDPARIGFWGVSQAGWVAPMAASMSEDIAFMIINSGGGVTPKESEYYSYGKLFEQAGLNEEAKKEAFDILDHYFQYLATGDGWDRLTARLDSLKNNPGAPLHQLPDYIIVPSQNIRPQWSWVATYDPVPDIATFEGPVLLLMGEDDNSHPVEAAVTKWKEGLEKAGNEDATIMVFPGAGHGLRQSGGHDRRAPYADGYMEVQLGWLWQQFLRNGQR